MTRAISDSPLPLGEVLNEDGIEAPRIIEAVRTVAKDVGATEQDIVAALPEAKADLAEQQASGRSSANLRAEKQEIADNQSSLPELFGSKEGESRSKSLSALISLIIPVLAGAAIGGKRSAAAGVLGAGQQLLALDKEERDESRRASEIDRRVEAQEQRDQAQFDRQRELDELRQEDRLELQGIREAFRRAEKQEKEVVDDAEDWWPKVPTAERTKLAGATGVIQEVEEVAKALKAIKGGPAQFQKDLFVSGTPANDVKAKVENLLPAISRTFGDVGNIAVSEQELRKRAILGNWTSDAADAARRTEELAASIRRLTTARLEFHKRVSTSGGDALLESLGGSEQSSSLDSAAEAMIRTLKEANASKGQVKKILGERMGLSITDEQIDGVR